MKLIRKCWLVLSIVAMMCGLCGCDSLSYEDKADLNKLIGTWESDPVDVSKIVNKTLMETPSTSDWYEYLKLDEIKIPVVLEIREDGSYIRNLERSSVKEAMLYAENFWRDGICRYYEDEMARLGVKNSVNSYLQQKGISLDSQLDSIKTDITNALLDNAVDKGYYRVKDGKFYKRRSSKDEKITNLYDTYVFEVDILRFYESGANVSSDLANTDMRELMNNLYTLSFHEYTIKR